MMAILWAKPSFSNASRPARGISDPLVAISIAQGIDEVDDILSDAPSPDRETMRIKQYTGFGFIASYATLSLALGAFFARAARLERRSWGRSAAIAAALAAVGAAVFDVRRSVAILRILDVDLRHTTQAMIDAMRWSSIGKWALMLITLGLFAILFLASRLRMMQAVGVACGAAAVLVLYGLYDNAALAWVKIPVAAALLGLTILFFRPALRSSR
jgi:hypothetical protein